MVNGYVEINGIGFDCVFEQEDDGFVLVEARIGTMDATEFVNCARIGYDYLSEVLCDEYADSIEAEKVEREIDLRRDLG